MKPLPSSPSVAHPVLLAVVGDRVDADADWLEPRLLAPLRAGGFVPLLCATDEALDRCEAVLVVGRHTTAVLASLVRLRRGERALLPLVANVRDDDDAAGLVSPRWSTLADALIDADAGSPDVIMAIGRVRFILARLAGLRPVAADTPPSLRRALMLLRFVASRGAGRVVPERDPFAAHGHTLGPLELIGGADLDDDLAALVDAGLLERSFAERLHVCAACGDARLVFREVCPACASADLARGELIHHYACATVAPEASFAGGRCPGCDGPLAHAGVDFERPAALVWCRACATAAAEGPTHARCLACGHGQLANDTGTRTLYAYALTEAGDLAARLGRWPATRP